MNLLEAEGVSLKMTFAINVAAEEQVYVMVYKNDAWNQIEQVVNNGEGTITCVFEHLYPVAVIVEDSTATSSVNGDDQDTQTGGQNVMLWVGILAVSSVALVTLLANKRRKQK